MNVGTKGQLIGRGIIGGKSELPPIDAPLTLSEMGLSKDISSRSKKLIEIPEDIFKP